MIIAGWGKKGKEIAYFGYMKCEHCKNHSEHRLFEIANRVTLYFIPVAKFNYHYYLVCEICDMGREIDKDRKDEALRLTLHIPDSMNFRWLWRELDNELNNSITDIADQKITPSELFDHVKEKYMRRFEGHFPTNQLEYVYNRFVLRVTEDDGPK